MDNKTVLIIGGPTAVGKTATSIEMAKRFGGEVVSADPCKSISTWILAVPNRQRKRWGMCPII